MFGGNSNWRGPIWMPVNALIIRALLQYYSYYGDEFTVECPTGSGQLMTCTRSPKRSSDASPRSSCAMHRVVGPSTAGWQVPGRPELARPDPLLRVLPRRQRGRPSRRAGGPRPGHGARARGRPPKPAPRAPPRGRPGRGGGGGGGGTPHCCSRTRRAGGRGKGHTVWGARPPGGGAAGGAGGGGHMPPAPRSPAPPPGGGGGPGPPRGPGVAPPPPPRGGGSRSRSRSRGAWPRSAARLGGSTLSR